MPFVRYHAERGGLGDLRHPPLLQSVERKIPVHKQHSGRRAVQKVPDKSAGSHPPSSFPHGGLTEPADRARGNVTMVTNRCRSPAAS